MQWNRASKCPMGSRHFGTFCCCTKTTVEIDAKCTLLSRERRKRCILFEQLPSEASYPNYYDVIENPISMDIIKQRIEGGYYTSIKVFLDDWLLMFGNARTYNRRGSLVYKDAVALQVIIFSYRLPSHQDCL